MSVAKSLVHTNQDYSDVLVDWSSDLPLSSMLHLHRMVVVLLVLVFALKMILMVVVQ